MLTCVAGTTGSVAGDRSADWNEATASNSSLAGVDLARHRSHVAVPVVYNRRMLYLHAVCLACLGALPDGDPRGGRSSAVDCGTAPVRSKIACRFCGSRWTTGQCLVLGTLYTYDVFACAPCCAARRSCRRCGGPPVILGNSGPKPPASALDAPANFSDSSRLAKCSWCGLEDYHFVKTFDEGFVCAERSK